MILFPAIDLRQGRCVRLQQGRADRERVFSEDPVAVAREWQARGARWLHLVNLDGAFGEANANLETIREIVAAVSIPVQLGGGLRDLEAASMGLALGISRVILGTVAVTEPQVVAEAVKSFGSERVIVGIDAREGRVAISGWTELSPLDALDLARRVAELGVKRVIYTDIARDGMLVGADIEGTRRLAHLSRLKVIASGGVASLDDLRRLRALEPYGVEGIIVGRALYEGAFSLEEALKIVS